MASAMTMTPEALHNAFIAIDRSSPGGAKWKAENRLDFAFLTDEEWTDEVSANYATHDVIGRSEQYYIYQNTGNRELPLNITFHAQGGRGGDYESSIRREVREKVDWCRALAYPVYVERRMLPPPVIFVYLGRLYDSFDILRCIVQSVSVTYNGPVSSETHASHGADVAMSLVRVANSSANLYDAESVGKYS